MVFLIRNGDIEEVFLGVPEGHRHLRCALVLKGGKTLLLHEATLANIARAYITLKTHPQKRALHLKHASLPEDARKPDFAQNQLLEQPTPEEEIIKTLTSFAESAQLLDG